MNHVGFRKELEQLINKHSMENGSNTPDFILADFLVLCLAAFDAGVQVRETCYGRKKDDQLWWPENGPIVGPASSKFDIELGKKS